MNLLYNITFSPASTFCALNFFERSFSPNTLLIEAKTISGWLAGMDVVISYNFFLEFAVGC
jgi:hypothetical protein